jgi:Methyltransferase domain
MLERARSRGGPRLDLVQADFARLPFGIQTFDLLVLSFSARHSPELTLMLTQAATTLVRNGHVVLMEYSGETQLALAGAVMRCYSLLAEAKERPAEVATAYFSACPDGVLLSAATAAGLRIKELDYVYLVEADGCESVVDFVMNSPPVAFDFIRYGRTTRDRVRSQLLADCHERILSEQVASKILICVMDRPDGG